MEEIATLLNSENVPYAYGEIDIEVRVGNKIQNGDDLQEDVHRQALEEIGQAYGNPCAQSGITVDTNSAAYTVVERELSAGYVDETEVVYKEIGMDVHVVSFTERPGNSSIHCGLLTGPELCADTCWFTDDERRVPSSNSATICAPSIECSSA